MDRSSIKSVLTFRGASRTSSSQSTRDSTDFLSFAPSLRLLHESLRTSLAVLLSPAPVAADIVPFVILPVQSVLLGRSIGTYKLKIVCRLFFTIIDAT